MPFLIQFRKVQTCQIHPGNARMFMRPAVPRRYAGQYRSLAQRRPSWLIYLPNIRCAGQKRSRSSQPGTEATAQAPQARDKAASADAEDAQDAALLAVMEEELSDEQVAASLREWGQQPTGDKRKDMLILLPFEKTRRAVNGTLPAPSGGQASESPPENGNSKDSAVEDSLQPGSRSAEERSSREASTSASGLTGPQAESTPEFWKGFQKQLEGRLKADLQAELRGYQMKLTGRKSELIQSLLDLHRSAAEAGYSPEEYRQKQLAGELDDAKPKTNEDAQTDEGDPSTPLESWTLPQLRTALRRRKISPRGNKGDMISRMRTLRAAEQSEGTEPAQEVQSIEAPAPWEAEPVATDQAPEWAARVEEHQLQSLTVAELLNLLKAKRIPVGLRKRKVDLIRRLMETHPATARKQDQARQREPPVEDELAAERKEMLEAVQEYLPDWKPVQEGAEVEEWPLINIRRELLEVGLSTAGSRAELVARLKQSQRTLDEQLKDLQIDQIADLLQRFDLPSWPEGETEAREMLTSVLETYPWFGNQASRFDETPLIGVQPWPQFLAPADTALTVAVIAALTLGMPGQLALRSAQTVLQHLHSAPLSDPGGGGISVDLYFLEGDLAWRCPAKHVYAATETDFRVALEYFGERLESKQALLDALKQSGQVVLPIVSEEDRQLLQDLDQAGIDYVGSTFDAGLTATHKHECNLRLSELGYPTMPQLHLTTSDIGSDFEEASSDGLAMLTRLVSDWASANCIFEEGMAMLVKPVRSSSAVGVNLARGFNTAAAFAADIIAEEGEAVIEPLLRNVVEFSVLVVDTPDGPRASLPLEIELTDPHEDMVDMNLEVQRFFAKLQEGWVDEDELDAEVARMKEEYMISEPELVLYNARKKHLPSGVVRIHSPPRLPSELTMGIRDAAAKAFRDLGLRDYARVDGFVQLLPKDMPKREKPAEVDHYEVPSVHELAERLKPMDNVAAGMVPPWDPPPEEEEEDPDAWCRALIEDGGFENMGPYTDPEIAKQYHSHDVELRPIENSGMQDSNGDPQVEIVYPSVNYTEEEEEEILADGAEWEDESFVDDNKMALEFADDVDEWDAENKRWITKEEPDEEELGVAAIHDDVSPPEYDTVTPQELCWWEAGTIIVADVNVSPTLEQTGLVFQAAAHSGLSQAGLLRHLVSIVCQRSGLEPLQPLQPDDLTQTMLAPKELEEPALTWDDFPPVTERDMHLPWWHERFKLSFFEDDADFEEEEAEDDADVDLEGPLARQLADDGVDEDATVTGEEEEVIEEKEEDEEDNTGSEEAVQQVWVLCGGEGTQADLSLQSGLHAYQELRRQPDLQVELFVLAPPCGGLKERERRKTLLFKHAQRIKITSNPNTPQPDELQLHNIRNPPEPHVELLMREVWAVPQHLVLRNSVIEVQEACEAAALDNSTIDRLQQPWQKDAWRLRCFVRDQLLQAGVQDAGKVWGADLEPTAPVCLDFYEFGVRAGVNEALIFSTLHGGVGESGEVQSLLDRFDVPYIGSGPLATATCCDKGQTADAVAELDMQVIETPPKYHLTTQRLLKETLEEGSLHSLTANIREHLGLAEGEAMCIKPANDGGGVGVARIDTETDLATYAGFLEERADYVVAFTLSWDNPPIPLPRNLPKHFYIEPFIHTGSLVVQQQEEGGNIAVAWSGPNHWAEVSIGLLGPRGSMRALTPSVTAHTPSITVQIPMADQSESDARIGLQAELSEEAAGEFPSDSSGFDGEAGTSQAGSGDLTDNLAESEETEPSIVMRDATQPGDPVSLCPPPQDIVSPDTLASVQERAEVVADRLGLSGYATLEGFMNADTGNLTVTEVNILPPLHAGSPFLTQALAEHPPVFPADLMRKLARIALTTPTEQNELQDEMAIKQEPVRPRAFRGEADSLRARQFSNDKEIDDDDNSDEEEDYNLAFEPASKTAGA